MYVTKCQSVNVNSIEVENSVKVLMIQKCQ